MAFETPHTDWASPYALGKVRLLYFGQGFRTEQSFDARHLIELMQRFDFEAPAIYFAYRGDLGRNYEAARWQRIRRLLDQPWDCLLFSSVPIADLRVEAQYKVLKTVAEGAGLVLMDTNGDRVLKVNNKVNDLPVFLANDPIGPSYRLQLNASLKKVQASMADFRQSEEQVS